VSDLVYLYAVVLAQPPKVDILGIDDRSVRFVSEGQLCAAVSDVPVEEFDEGPLNANVKDMTWLAPRAIAHQEVNHQLHEHVEAMVPLAFGTVFRDDQRVVTMLRAQADALRERLARVRGRSEWVVALHRTGQPEADAFDEVSDAVRELRAEVDAASPGRAHLLKRKLAEVERDELRRIDAEVVDDVVRLLQQRVDDVYREAIPSDVAERPLLRASVLVARTREAEFVELIESEQTRWRRHGYQLQLTGPWPPYRFAGLSADERHVAAR
jgi:hypothetical protein